MSQNVPLIIGIVLAAVLLVGIIVAAILMNRSDKKKNSSEYSDKSADDSAAEETPSRLALPGGTGRFCLARAHRSVRLSSSRMAPMLAEVTMAR